MKLLHLILLNLLFLFGLFTAYSQKLEFSVQSGHLEAINKIAFSNSGKLLMGGDDNGVVKCIRLYLKATYAHSKDWLAEQISGKSKYCFMEKA